VDKYEFNLKLEQFKKLIEKKDYEVAAKIADSLDVHKIKSIPMLTTIADVYEVVGDYRSAKEVLVIAFEKSSMGRQIAYKLAVLSAKLGQVREAKEYYEEYVEMAPNNISKYLLEYEIAKAENADVTVLISILEKYMAEDMDEKWAYVLAVLYHKAGMGQKCVEMCDTIILWFNGGKFVKKALDLKMLYVPLSSEQQEMLDGSKDDEKTKRMKYTDETASTVVFTPVKETSAHKTEESVEEPVGEPVAESLEEAEAEEVLKVSDSENAADEQVQDIEEETEEIQESKEISESEDDIMHTTEIDYTQIRVKELDVNNKFNTVNIQAEIAESMASLLSDSSGETPDISGATKEFTAFSGTFYNASNSEIMEVSEEVAEKAKEDEYIFYTSTDPINPLYELEGDGQVSISAPEPKKDDDQIEGQLTIEDILAEYEKMNREAAETDEVEDTKESDEVDEAEPEAEVEPVAEELEIEAGEEVVEEPSEDVEIDEIEGFEEFEDFEEIDEPDEELETDQVTEIDEVDNEPEEEPIEEAYEATEEAEENFEEVTESGELVQEELTEEVEIDEIEGFEEFVEDETEDFEEYDEEAAEEDEESEESEENEGTEEITEDYAEEPEANGELEEPAEEELEESEEPAEEEPAKTEKKPEKTADVNLKKELKSFISKYGVVTGLDNGIIKILEKLIKDYDRDGTSKTNNVFITGNLQSGKTTMARDLIKLVNKIRHREHRRIAKTNAIILNKKGVKFALSALEDTDVIIEKASSLTADSINELLEVIDGYTGNMMVVFEDERTAMEQMFATYPKVKNAFNVVFGIKEMTIGDWAKYAQNYVAERGFELDDMAMLALHAQLDRMDANNQGIDKDDVEDLMEDVMEEATKGIGNFFKRIFKKKDEDSVVVIREDHFY